MGTVFGMGFTYHVRRLSVCILPRVVATASIGGYIAFCVFAGGCGEPRVPSPKEPGRSVPMSQALLERDEIVIAKATEARKADARFTIAVKRLQAATEIDLAELTAAHDETVEKLQAEAKSVRETTDLAIKAAQEKQEAWLSGLGTVATIAQSTGIPGVATFGGLLAGAVGLFSAAASKRTANTATQKAAAEAASRAATEEAAARVVDSLDLLKALSPEVKAAFKAHAPALMDWQGVGGVKLVQSVQNS